jgi:hypothetical protein
MALYGCTSPHYDPARQSRCDGMTATCPPPVRQQIDTSGIAADGRIFSRDRGSSK